MDSALRKDYRLIAFDLDDTLAPSKSPLPDRMAACVGFSTWWTFA